VERLELQRHGGARRGDRVPNYSEQDAALRFGNLDFHAPALPAELSWYLCWYQTAGIMRYGTGRRDGLGACSGAENRAN